MVAPTILQGVVRASWSPPHAFSLPLLERRVYRILITKKERLASSMDNSELASSMQETHQEGVNT